MVEMEIGAHLLFPVLGIPEYTSETSELPLIEQLPSTDSPLKTCKYILRSGNIHEVNMYIICKASSNQGNQSISMQDSVSCTCGTRCYEEKPPLFIMWISGFILRLNCYIISVLFFFVTLQYDGFMFKWK